MVLITTLWESFSRGWRSPAPGRALTNLTGLKKKVLEILKIKGYYDEVTSCDSQPNYFEVIVIVFIVVVVVFIIVAVVVVVVVSWLCP